MPKMDPKGAEAMRKAMTGGGEPGILEKIRKALGLEGDTEPAAEDVGRPDVKKEKTRQLLQKLRGGSNIQPSPLEAQDEDERLKQMMEEEAASRIRRASSKRGPVE